MLLRNIMKPNPVVAEPSMPLVDAVRLMKERKIRRLPVVLHGELVGIVTDRDLKEASASGATSLSVWELNYVLAKMTLGGLMKTPVITLPPDAPIERASRTMLEHKIGGIPIVGDGRLVGIVTESDLFRLMTTLLGGDDSLLKVTLRDCSEVRAQLPRVLEWFAESLQSLFFSPAEREVELTFRVRPNTQDASNCLLDIRRHCGPYVTHVKGLKTGPTGGTHTSSGIGA